MPPTFTAVDVPVSIPDTPGSSLETGGVVKFVAPAVSSAIVVSGVDDAATLRVRCTVETTDPENLHLWVAMPGSGGHVADLHWGGGPLPGYLATGIDATAPGTASNGPANGTWRLWAQDEQADNGTVAEITAWSLEFNPPEDPPPVEGTDPGTVVDDFTPGAPADSNPECRSLLTLVQEFSLAVKRAVRITGPSTIAMVDPNAPLPAGWYLEDAAAMYVATEHSIQAGDSGVSYAYQDLDMSAGAALVRGDVRLLMSTWRIPDRVPVYELDAAPVKRITHTFTPTSYTASVELHIPTIPTAARRP